MFVSWTACTCKYQQSLVSEACCVELWRGMLWAHPESRGKAVPFFFCCRCLSRGGDLHPLVNIRDEEGFAARVTENAAQSPSQQGPMQHCGR